MHLDREADTTPQPDLHTDRQKYIVYSNRQIQRQTVAKCMYQHFNLDLQLNKAPL